MGIAVKALQSGGGHSIIHLSARKGARLADMEGEVGIMDHPALSSKFHRAEKMSAVSVWADFGRSEDGKSAFAQLPWIPGRRAGSESNGCVGRSFVISRHNLKQE